jgi:predicted ATPase/class 3 adenylate cyclase
MDIGSWLRDLGFERYEPVFVESAIDSDVLPELTEADLEKLGIPLGDRKRLMKAIRGMLTDSPGALVTTGIGGSAQNGQPRAAVAERRHLTVMICDLVGSTALSARLDPEDTAAVFDAYHAACARIITAYDGFLGDFRGDGILSYFGYPRAHEDDAERTVRAGLDIVDAVARLETRAGEPLAVRIGIATGLVVVGDLSGEGALWDHAVVGDSPNLAARLQALAAPGKIVIAGSTRRLLGELFRLRDLGKHEVKGIAEPVAAWSVEGVLASESRFEAAHVAGLTELIDRKDEINFLLDRQRRAWKGEGQIVLISGDPGIGKSRMMAALAERIAGKRHTRLLFQCSMYHSNSVLHPVIAQMERAAGFKADDTPEQRLDKLEAIVAAGLSRVQEGAALFATLLSLPFGERYPPLALSPTQQRRRTLAALLDLFEALARQQPILLLFEDAHWADATSLELLNLMVERVRQLPVLALLTFRPDFEPPWVGLPNVSNLALGRLPRRYVESMITQVAAGRVLPVEVMKQFVAKTDGNPLFIEELTKAVLEAGILIEDGGSYRPGPLPPLAIPATLQDSLMARLDRLGPAKEIAQIGSAIGREFSYSLMGALVGRDDAALKHALAQLEQAELVFRRGDPPEAVYSFKHALVQDVAYDSLLKSRRQQLHGEIARALERRFPNVVESEPEIVARHFTGAGFADPAIDYWLKAGNLALSRSANAEAVKHLRQGIDLIQTQAHSPKRVRQELDFYLALGPAMAATEGDAAPETLRVFSHARELLGNTGTPSEQMTVFWGAYLAHSERAEHGSALEVAQQFLALADHHEHSGMSALANRFMGQTLNYMGAFVDARHQLERTLALCAAHQGTIATYRRFGTDDEVMALSFLASTLLLLGYPEQSAAAMQQAVSRARAMGRAFTTALALGHVAFLGVMGWDPQSAAAYAEEAIAHSVEHELAGPEHRARFYLGALLAQGGDPQHGIELMGSAIAAAESNVARKRLRPLHLGHVASAHTQLGRPEVGLDLLDEAIQTAESTNERFFEAELFRLKGTALLTLGRRGEAEACMLRALTIARRQQARWWELRAATSLAQLWHAEGKRAEAYSLLEPVYRWFVEGFDTADLQAAKALLDALADLSGPRATCASAVAGGERRVEHQG